MRTLSPAFKHLDTHELIIITRPSPQGPPLWRMVITHNHEDHLTVQTELGHFKAVALQEGLYHSDELGEHDLTPCMAEWLEPYT